MFTLQQSQTRFVTRINTRAEALEVGVDVGVGARVLYGEDVAAARGNVRPMTLTAFAITVPVKNEE